jgi:hypothetical protein
VESALAPSTASSPKKTIITTLAMCSPQNARNMLSSNITTFTYLTWASHENFKT